MSTGAANEIKSSKRKKGGRAATEKSLSYAAGSTETAEPSFLLPPLKPRPRLFFLLLGVLALWIAALLFMYLRLSGNSAS